MVEKNSASVTCWEGKNELNEAVLLCVAVLARGAVTISTATCINSIGSSTACPVRDTIACLVFVWFKMQQDKPLVSSAWQANQ